MNTIKRKDITEMESLSEKQTLALDALIYCDGFVDAVENKENHTVEDIVDELIQTIPQRKENNSKYEYNAKTSQEEWIELLEYIKDDPTLSRMEFDKNTFEDHTKYNEDENPKTEYVMDSNYDGFRAILFYDPKKIINNTVIVRGTATDWQWHDNFAPAQGIAVSPQQHQIIQYLIKIGYTNIDISGHSKGGNLSETAAFMLPNGIINRAISYDGQRYSKDFLDLLTEFQKKCGSDKTLNINELRDLVSKLYLENMEETNSKYFKSTDSFLNFIMFHKPTLFLHADEAEPHEFKKWLDKFGNAIEWLMERKSTGKVLKWIADKQFEDGWTDSFYAYAKAADKFYQDLVIDRMTALIQLYTELGIEDASAYYEVYQDSELVDGAIISCIYCNVLGELRMPMSHGRMTRNKPVIAITDTVEGENVIFENGLCFPATQETMYLALFSPFTQGGSSGGGGVGRRSGNTSSGMGRSSSSPGRRDGSSRAMEAREAKSANNDSELTVEEKLEEVVAQPCIPETSGNEWLITDGNKVVSDGGATLRAALLKSILYCEKGGVISIVYNGQSI